jgi:uncharacterized membrane protein
MILASLSVIFTYAILRSELHSLVQLILNIQARVVHGVSYVNCVITLTINLTF